MCGLVGIASALPLSKDEKKIFEELLFIDTLRGPHSTGVFSVNRDHNVDVCKRVVDGPTFIQLNTYDRLFRNPLDLKILAGHNRYATRGRLNIDNAHPFHHEDIILMHNGTLTSESTLNTGQKFGTDSEHIAYALSQVEPEQATTVLEKIYGAFALVWYDMRDNTLNMARNEKRPLYLCSNAAQSTAVWASERYMIDMVESRVSSTFSLPDKALLPVLQHYKIKLEEGKVKVLSVTDFKEYKPPVVSYIPKQQQQTGGQHLSKKPVSDYKDSYPAAPEDYPVAGDIINVCPTNFAPYRYDKESQFPKGCIEACYDIARGPTATDLHMADVHFHNQTAENYADWSDDQNWVKGKVVNVTYSPSLQTHVIYCRYLSTISWEEKLEEEMEDEYDPITADLIENAYDDYPGGLDLDDFSDIKKSPHYEDDFGDDIAELEIDIAEQTRKTVVEGQTGKYCDVYKDYIEPNSLETLIEFIDGPGNMLLSYSQWKKKTDCGCQGCGISFELRDAEDIVWEDEQTPLCKSCGELRQEGLL